MKIRHFLINLLQSKSLGVLCLTVLFFGAAPGVIAGEVSGLYEAEVPVKGQGDTERNKALNTALVEVLIKVSGNRNVTSMVALQPVLSRPMGMVQQFRYRALPKSETQQSSRSQDTAVVADSFTQVLLVSFDPQAVNLALNNAGLPVWGRARPSTLVWLAIEDHNQRYLLGGDRHLDFQELIKQEAQRRGIPVLIPLMDLEDQANLRFTDVWGNFQDMITEASDRYQAEAILVGRLYRQSDDVWQARWSLYLKDGNLNNGSQFWELTADQSSDVIASGINGSADILSAKFSKILSEEESDAVMMQITDINTLEDYARTMKYLSSLDPVTRLQVEEVTSSTVTFMLGIRSDRIELVQAIGFGSILAPVLPSKTNPAVNDNLSGAQTIATTQPLYYRLLK